MNLLCVDQFSDLGGGQRSLLDLLPSFTQRGWSVSIAAPGRGPFRSLLEDRKYPVHEITCGSYSIVEKPAREILKYACELPQLAASLTQIVKSRLVDLIYVNGPRVLPPAAWVSRRTGIPLVFHGHNRLLQGSAIALAGRSLQLAKAHVIACCRHAAQPLVPYVESKRLRIVFNGVPDMAPGGLVPRRRLRTVGVLGRIEREKGQLEFVKAARLVLRHLPGCRFKIIGTPMFSDTEYYEKVVAESDGLPVEFLGWKSDVAEVFQDLDLLVVPSTAAEATTRVILEAYSAGVCVVSLPSGGIPEILEDGKTGFLATDGTVESLARRMIEVLHMSNRELDAVVRRARAEWTTRFTLDSYREQVCHSFDQVLDLTPSSQPHRPWQ